MPERPLVVEESPAPEDLMALRQGLIDYNLARIDRPLATDVAAFVRVDMGRVVAGVNGEIRWGWLFVDRLWVDDGLREQGLGSKLLLMAEEACRTRGVTRIMDRHQRFSGSRILPNARIRDFRYPRQPSAGAPLVLHAQDRAVMGACIVVAFWGKLERTKQQGSPHDQRF